MCSLILLERFYTENKMCNHSVYHQHQLLCFRQTSVWLSVDLLQEVLIELRGHFKTLHLQVEHAPSPQSGQVEHAPSPQSGQV